MSSKLREALKNARSLIYEGIETEVKDDIEHPFHLELSIEKIDEALAEPLRNCEVGTAEEQSKRFKKYCALHKSFEWGCEKCPIFPYKIIKCEFLWSQMQYESEVKE